jgi:hypothetical protein
MTSPVAYLKNDRIDRERWDEAIAASPHGIVYAASWYLDIVSPGWEALVEEDYSLCFPLTWRKKWGIRYLFQPPFTQQLGAFFRDREVSPSDLDRVLRSVPPAFRYVDIFLHHSNATGLLPGWRVIQRKTHHLPLEQSVETLRSRYSTNLQRNLKKASHLGLGVTADGSVDELIALFRMHRGKNIGTLREADYAILRRLAAAAESRGLLTFLCIRKNGRLLAGAMFLRSLHEHIFLFSATHPEARNTGALAAILDEFIRRQSGSPRPLDFEGSMDPDLSRFYRGFGAAEIVYLHVQHNRLPLWARWLKQ